MVMVLLGVIVNYFTTSSQTSFRGCRCAIEKWECRMHALVYDDLKTNQYIYL